VGLFIAKMGLFCGEISLKPLTADGIFKGIAAAARGIGFFCGETGLFCAEMGSFAERCLSTLSYII